MTGVADPALLRASHIVPWAECDDDAQRLDVYNGLLLSALWDAAFDAGKVSFSDEGEPLFHAELGETERNLLREKLRRAWSVSCRSTGRISCATGGRAGP